MVGPGSQYNLFLFLETTRRKGRGGDAKYDFIWEVCTFMGTREKREGNGALLGDKDDTLGFLVLGLGIWDPGIGKYTRSPLVFCWCE